MSLNTCWTIRAKGLDLIFSDFLQHFLFSRLPKALLSVLDDFSNSYTYFRVLQQKELPKCGTQTFLQVFFKVKVSSYGSSSRFQACCVLTLGWRRTNTSTWTATGLCEEDLLINTLIRAITAHQQNPTAVHSASACSCQNASSRKTRWCLNLHLHLRMVEQGKIRRRNKIKQRGVDET